MFAPKYETYSDIVTNKKVAQSNQKRKACQIILCFTFRHPLLKSCEREREREREEESTFIKRERLPNPAPGDMKFTILVDPSLVINTIYLVCLLYT